MIDQILKSKAEQLVGILRERGINSAKVEVKDEGVVVTIDRAEAMTAEYGGSSEVTSAIMQAGGRPA